MIDLQEQGLTKREIADTLYLSSRTVEHRVAAIFSKLGGSSRAEAVAVARNASDGDPLERRPPRRRR